MRTLGDWVKRVVHLGSSVQPIWTTDGVPRCGYEACPSYDGKRCSKLGSKPDGVCIPTVVEMAKVIEEET